MPDARVFALRPCRYACRSAGLPDSGWLLGDCDLRPQYPDPSEAFLVLEIAFDEEVDR
jgi:hypothetical protein